MTDMRIVADLFHAGDMAATSARFTQIHAAGLGSGLELVLEGYRYLLGADRAETAVRLVLAFYGTGVLGDDDLLRIADEAERNRETLIAANFFVAHVQNGGGEIRAFAAVVAAAIDGGRDAEALSFYLQARQRGIALFNASMIKLAKRLIDQGAPDIARTVYEDALKDQAFGFLAKLLFETKVRPKDAKVEALDDVTGAFVRRENDPLCQSLLALLEECYGDHSIALSRWRALFERHPDDAEIARHYIRLCTELRLYDAAELACRTVLARNPENWEITDTLSRMLEMGGRIDESIAVYRALADRTPDDPLVWFWMAYRCRSYPRHADAGIAAFRQATMLDPGMSAAWVNLCLMLQIVGDDEGAIEALRRARRPGIELYSARMSAWPDLMV